MHDDAPRPETAAATDAYVPPEVRTHSEEELKQLFPRVYATSFFSDVFIDLGGGI